MKLLNTLLLASATADDWDDWHQPSYQEVMDIVSSDGRSDGEWGHPTDRIAALWSLCPALDVPTGVSSLACDQSTCAVICEDGFVGTGKRRTRCRYNRRNGFFWKQQLGACESCDDLTPPAGIKTTCSINPRRKRMCVTQCETMGDVLELTSRKPKKMNIKCRCPRDPVTRARSCGWYSRKFGSDVIEQSDMGNLTCSTPPTTQAPDPTTGIMGDTTTAGAAAATTTAAAGAATTTAAAGAATTTTAAPPATTAAGGFAALTDLIDGSLTYCSEVDNGIGTRSGKIVGGTEAGVNSWPFIANLFLQSQAQVDAAQGFGSQCGGTIIANNWVLSAGHCCVTDTGLPMVSVFSTFGQHAVENPQATPEFQLQSTLVINHPDYGDASDGNAQNTDYCLIKFATDIIAQGSAGNVAIGCLATTDPVGGEACWVAGWGTTSYGGSGSDVLLSVGVNILSQAYCIANTGAGSLMPDDICAGIPDTSPADGQTDGGKDSCQGDSGGPLICPIGGKATLVGVVSRGAGCADPNTAGLYSSTAVANQWIKDTIAAN